MYYVCVCEASCTLSVLSSCVVRVLCLRVISPSVCSYREFVIFCAFSSKIRLLEREKVNPVAVCRPQGFKHTPSLFPGRTLCNVVYPGFSFLWPPYEIGQAIIFLPCGVFLLSFFLA